MSAGKIWAACIAAVALLAALQEPVLFLWYLGIAVAFGALAGYAAAHWFRNERDEARTLAARLEAEANAHAAENARLTTELAARGPRLRVVPPQRDGSEYEWPRIARVLEIEEGGEGA